MGAQASRQHSPLDNMAKRTGSSELLRREERVAQSTRENVYKTLSLKEQRPPSSKSFLPAIDARPEFSYTKPQVEDMSSIELRARVRELEIQMLDLHSTLDRRLSSLHEELPNRLQAEIKLLQDRDGALWRDNNQKMQQLQDTVRMLAENIKRPLDTIGNEQGTMKKRLDELEIRTVTVSREVEYSRHAPKALTYEPPAPPPDSSEVQNVKHLLAEEQKRRELQLSDLHAQIQSLHSLLRSNEQENNRRYQQYRTEMLAAHQDSVEQTVKLDKTREDKVRSEQEYLRTVMSNLQRRVDEESKSRQQGESDFKLWTDDKVTVLQHAIKSDERGLMEREKNLLQQLQEGLTTLYEIVTKVKEHGAVQLTKTHTLMSENVKDLALALSSIKDQLHQRVEALEAAAREELRLRVETQAEIQGHFQTFAQLLDAQVTRLDNQQQTSENRLRAELLEFREARDRSETALQTWKAQLDAQLLAQVDSLQSQQEALISAVTRLEQDTGLQSAALKRELQTLDNRLQDEVAKTNGKVQFEAGLGEQRLDSAIQRVTDTLGQQVHDLRISVGKNVGELEKELQKRLEELDQSQQTRSRSELSTALAKEAATRKSDIATFENYIKQHISTTERNVLAEVDSQGNELVRRVEAVRDEVKELMMLVQSEKTEAGRVTDELYGALQDQEAKLRQFATEECGKQVEGCRNETSLLLETERELSLGELDKARKEISADIDALKAAFTLALNTDSQKTRGQVLEITTQEKNVRELHQKDMLKKIEDLGTATREAFNQSAESLKAVCKALVMEEKAERSHSEELILSSLSRRISKLEEVLKHDQKIALTDVAERLAEFTQTQMLKWEDLETSRRAQQGRIKDMVHDVDDRLGAAMVLRQLVDQVADSFERLEMQEGLAQATAAIEAKATALQEQVATATKTLNQEMRTQLEDHTGDLEFRLEASQCLNKMLDLLEFSETSGRLEVLAGNMDKLYKNLGQLDSVLTEQVEESKKALAQELREVRSGLQDKLEVVEEQQDLHTLQLDDLQIKTTVENLLTRVSGRDEAWLKTSVQLLLDEVSGLKNRVTAESQHAGAAEKNTMSVLQQLASSHEKAIQDIKDLARPAVEASSHLEDVEKRMAQLERNAGGSGLGDQVQHFGQEVMELRKALEQVKGDRVTQDRELGSRLDSMAASMVGVQGALTREIERNAGEQGRTQQSVLEQLQLVMQTLTEIKQKS